MGISVNSASGTIGDMNLKGSSFIAQDTTGLAITGNVNAESVVNSYENESKSTSKGFMSSKSSYKNSHAEENSASNLMLGENAVILGDVNSIGSNVVFGDNTYIGGKLTTDAQQLHNSYFEENKKKGFSGGISHGTASLSYGKSQNSYDEKSTINAGSNLQIGDGSVLNKGAEITATNFEYGNIKINNGDVKYGARIDTRDVHTESKSSSFGISVGINSPILDRAKQAGNAVKQVKDGDTAGGMIEVANAITGTVQGMSGNITKINGSRATMKDIENGDFKVNNSFYVGGNLRASFNKSKSSSDSHTESAVVTTMKPSNDNATITYNNVNNVTYQGTQAQGGTFIYNNVANIQKEAVELKNSYSSKNSSLGMGLSAGIGSKGSIKSNGISGNVSQSNGNLNTEGTNYQNGNFVNVNEVHNNTGSMTLTGFNQEGGKVTGNIEKLVVESKQNTSITTGSSRNVGVGFSGNGIPNSLNVSQNNTNGNKNYVENQSSFTVGQGSNLQVGTLENTASIIGKQSENATFKVNNYIGKNLENEDTMTTTGGSVGASLGQNPKITSVGFNQDSKEKEGITRNTVVGNVEIGQVSGDEINRDLSKANETTKDVHKTTNINIEPQLIEYTSNPTKFKEDLEVAVLEGKATGETVLKSIENVVNGGKEDIGDPERRSLNEIKETVIRVKTAPEMNLIATGDLNSQEVLNSLDINAIEKFNPDDPDLPENVRTRLDEVRRNGGEIEAFYDKTTNKIFINENVEDSKTRALVAREWKISEDLKTGKGKENEQGQLKATVAGELAYDDMMKRAGENKTRSISIDELKIGSMDIDSEITADFNNKHVDKFLGRVGSILNKVKKGDFKGAYKEAKQTKQDVTRVLKNDFKTVSKSKGGPAAKKTIKESVNATVYAVKKIVPKSKKKSTKKSPPKGKKTPVHKTKKEQEKEFIEHMNSITRGYYENEPEYLKIGAKVGTQAFIVANQNIKIGDGSSKVSDEVFAKAVSSTIGQVVATGNFKMVPTKDKEYENNNKGVQKQVKAAKVEAQRKTRNSKDKDYYVRVDGKNKTVTVEETKRPKGYGSYLYKSLVLDPIESFHNFHEAKKAAFHGNIGGAFKNTLKGIGNLTSPFTLGVGSWAGDNYARFKPEEVQYGTREEVLKRKQTENLLVSTPIDMTIGFATSKIPVKKIISSKFKNPVKSTKNTRLEYSRSVQEKAIETYHRTPIQFDYEMIKHGTSLNRNDGRIEYMMRGYVNGKEGVFHTTIRDANKVIHKNFVPKDKWNSYRKNNGLPEYDKIK